MTHIEQIPAYTLKDMIRFIEDYAWKLKAEREQKEKSAAASKTNALGDFEKKSLIS